MLTGLYFIPWRLHIPVAFIIEYKLLYFFGVTARLSKFPIKASPQERKEQI